MQYFGFSVWVVLIITFTWGLALLTGFFVSKRWLALAISPWLVVTMFFGIETYYGLGPDLRLISTLGVIFTIAITWLNISRWTGFDRFGWLKQRISLWRVEFSPSKMIWCMLCWVAFFSYTLIWRAYHPEIDGSSEKIPDLAYICSYLKGQTIPVTDAWLAPYKSTHYYSFQYYAAALLGRSLGLTPGVTYNLAFCCISAYCAIAFTAATVYGVTRSWARVVLVLCYVVGGTGATLIDRLLYNNSQPWFVMRFIHGQPYDRAGFGESLQSYASNFKRIELASEPFSYNIFLGDYHPTLSGFYLLGILGVCVVVWAKWRARSALVIMGASVPWLIISHTWVLPLHVIVILSSLVYFYKDCRHFLFFAGTGFAGTLIAIWPYLCEFCAAIAGYNTSLKFVPVDEHTPVLLFIIFWWPSIVLIILGYFSGRAGIISSVSAMFLLLISEIFYIDDIYVGEFNRFNTSLKWWPWIQSSILLAVGSSVLNCGRWTWVKFLGLIVCFYPCLYFLETWSFLNPPDKTLFAKFEGDHYLRKNDGVACLLDRLQIERNGVAIERLKNESFTNSASLPLFAGKIMWLGWSGHELLWRGNSSFVTQRKDSLMTFYSGIGEDSAAWLASENIDYVLWYQDEDTNELWIKIQNQISHRYEWIQVYILSDGKKIGYWRRLKSSMLHP